jgi:predicted RNase H-like HicB family nuclease
MSAKHRSEGRFALDKTYTITLRPEPEGGFTVRVPALPEIVTYGEDEREALAMAKDAIELCLTSHAERGEEIPESDAVVVHSVRVSIAA